MNIFGQLRKQLFKPVLLAAAWLTLQNPAQAQDAVAGEQLFQANCASCHAINEKITGPALKGVHERRDEAWLISWIKNSSKVIKSGDPYAQKIFNEYNQTQMTSFENLSDGEIKNILAYVKGAAAAPAPPAEGGGGVVVTAEPVHVDGAENDGFNTFGMLFLAAILFVIILVLFRVIAALKNIIVEKDPALAEEHESSVWKKLGAVVSKWNPTLVVMALLIFFTLVGSYYGFIYGNQEIGVQQGYAPEQPIAFPHDVHAGTYKIQCQYCHNTVEKSKQASIPSLNTCMNCHNHVTAKDKYNGEISPEIKKIYAALDYNPETRTYGKNQSPVKWVRVHNLPDHAYFNHSQHVKVGKQQCQTCHGEVEKMKVVSQHSTLQMGWCINCHRETRVDVEGNKYYEQIHSELKKQGKSSLKVANIGGLECSKCHY